MESKTIASGFHKTKAKAILEFNENIWEYIQCNHPGVLFWRVKPHVLSSRNLQSRHPFYKVVGRMRVITGDVHGRG